MIDFSTNPTPWEWVFPEKDTFGYDWSDHESYEGELPYLVDAEGNTVAYFGDTTQYYPSCGSVPDKNLFPLFSAAPDLYEVVEAFVAEWDKGTVENKTKIADMFKHVLAGRAALSKARGET